MSAIAARRARPLSPERVGRLFWRGAIYVVTVVLAVIFTFPFFWMVSSSVKPASEMMAMPPVWIPSTIVFDSYVRPFTNLPFLLFYRNTIFVTLMGMLGVLLSSSIVAFAFARMRWPGRDKFFVLMLATLMVPNHVTLIPTYVFYSKLDWINTFLPLLVPEWTGSPFIIFLMRQYMMTIPLEMDDAARIDGCGWFRLYSRIIVPLSWPVVGVAAIYSFTYHWNAFERPLIYLNRLELFTVPLGLAVLKGRYSTEFGSMMAMATVSVIPVLIVFFLAQRYFIQGVVVSGVKG
jgi:ABC-type glycerol-3-phosphate transport system permease component